MIDNNKNKITDNEWENLVEQLVHSEADKQSEHNDYRRRVDINNPSDNDLKFITTLEKAYYSGKQNEVNGFLRQYFEICLLKNIKPNDQINPMIVSNGGLAIQENGWLYSLSEEAITTIHSNVKKIRKSISEIEDFVKAYYSKAQSKYMFSIFHMDEDGVRWTQMTPSRLSLSGKTLVVLDRCAVENFYSKWKDNEIVNKEIFDFIRNVKSKFAIRIYGNTITLHEIVQIPMNRSQRRSVRRFSKSFGYSPDTYRSLNTIPDNNYIKEKAIEFFKNNVGESTKCISDEFMNVLLSAYVKEVVFQSSKLSEILIPIFSGSYKYPVAFEGRDVWLKDLTKDKQGRVFVIQTNYGISAKEIEKIDQSIFFLSNKIKSLFETESIKVNYVHDDYFSYTSHAGYNDEKREEYLVDIQDESLNKRNVKEIKNHFKISYKKMCKKHSSLSEEEFIFLYMSDYIFSIVVVLDEEIDIKSIDQRFLKISEHFDYYIDVMLPGYGIFQNYDKGWYEELGNMKNFIPQIKID